jgi:hypothetical protein
MVMLSQLDLSGVFFFIGACTGIGAGINCQRQQVQGEYECSDLHVSKVRNNLPQ